MTSTDLHEIKARYEATTVAPWVASIEGRDHESGSHFIMTGILKGEDIWQEKRGEDFEIHGATIADLDFIANARQDIPALVAEVERLQNLLVKKNEIGTPINVDVVLEDIVHQFEIESNTNLKVTIIDDYEVLFAQVDVTELNATQIFNLGIVYGNKLYK